MIKYRRRMGLGLAAALLLGWSVYAAVGGPQRGAPRNQHVPPDDSAKASEPGSGDKFPLDRNETASVLLELRQKIGSNVDGVFDTGDVVLDDDRAFAETVRGLEQDDQNQAGAEYAPPPAWPDLPSAATDGRVESLRSVGEQLDQAANRLERLELYERADQLRELAQQLRLDARGGPAAEPVPQPDFKTSAAPGLVIPAQKYLDGDTELELTAGSSRTLTLDAGIQALQVRDGKFIEAQPSSSNAFKLTAKQPGRTQIMLWDASDQRHTIEVLVTGDLDELTAYLKREFPTAKLQISRTTEGIVISGTVGDPHEVPQIMEISQDFFPRVTNWMSVGPVPQVLLHVKVIEVNRAARSVSGLITECTADQRGGEAVPYGIINNTRLFFGMLEAWRRNKVSKVLSEPSQVSVTVGGRPVGSNYGGEFPALVPRDWETVSIETKPSGTQVKILPLLLANGNIRLEVRPPNATATGVRIREMDTGIEIRPGQTLAIGGLLQAPAEGDRLNSSPEDEMELLILVTPEVIPPREPAVDPAPESDFQTNTMSVPAVRAPKLLTERDRLEMGDGSKRELTWKNEAEPVNQVLVHTKIIEVSRTKLRKLGFDWASIDGKDCAVQTVSGLITQCMADQPDGETRTHGIIDDTRTFFGVLEALRQNKVSKILAEPSLVTVSGRPASFNSGGEFPILVPQGPEKVSIEYRKFGTQIDVLPTVLANGNIRLELRPQISEIDPDGTVKLGNITVPGLRVRRVNTFAELRPGQTLAMGGLVQKPAEGKTEDGAEDEIELLIVVTPELVTPLEHDDIPPHGGPHTQRPPQPQIAPTDRRAQRNSGGVRSSTDE